MKILLPIIASLVIQGCASIDQLSKESGLLNYTYQEMESSDKFDRLFFTKKPAYRVDSRLFNDGKLYIDIDVMCADDQCVKDDAYFVFLETHVDGEIQKQKKLLHKTQYLDLLLKTDGSIEKYKNAKAKEFEEQERQRSIQAKKIKQQEIMKERKLEAEMASAKYPPNMRLKINNNFGCGMISCDDYAVIVATSVDDIPYRVKGIEVNGRCKIGGSLYGYVDRANTADGRVLRMGDSVSIPMRSECGRTVKITIYTNRGNVSYSIN